MGALLKEIRCQFTIQEIRCQFTIQANPVSVHHSCPSKSGVEQIREQIRCQFIILARKDEPTADYAGHRGQTDLEFFVERDTAR